METYVEDLCGAKHRPKIENQVFLGLGPGFGVDPRCGQETVRRLENEKDEVKKQVIDAQKQKEAQMQQVCLQLP